jgi:MFS family permease
MFPAAMGYGALTQTRTAVAASTFGGAAGIGGVAIVLAVAGAAAALTSGALSDRRGPRPVFVATTIGAAAVNLSTAALLAGGHLSLAVFVVAVASAAVFTAMNMTAVVPLSMGIAGMQARAAVQIVNMLRMAIGIMAGLWLAGTVARPVPTLLIAAVVVPTCSLIAAAIATRAPVPSRPPNSAGGSNPRVTTGVLATLRAERPLMAAFWLLLVLDLVVPSQLVAIVLTDNDLFHRVHQLLLAGLVGVLISRLTLLVTGLRLRVRLAMLGAFSTYTAVAVIGAFLLVRGSLLSNHALVVAFVFVASMTSAFTLEVASALVQQRCPDEVRGRITGALQAGRTLMTSAGVALAATVQVAADEAPLVAGLAALAVLVLVITRGFATIDERPAAAHASAVK